ncbi:unnamed protein product [Prunus armeniaca]
MTSACLPKGRCDVIAYREGSFRREVVTSARVAIPFTLRKGAFRREVVRSSRVAIPFTLRKGAFRREVVTSRVPCGNVCSWKSRRPNGLSRRARAISDKVQVWRSDFRRGVKRFFREPDDFRQPCTAVITRCLIILKEKVKSPQVPIPSVGKSLRVVATMKTWVLMGKILGLNVWWKG